MSKWVSNAHLNIIKYRLRNQNNPRLVCIQERVFAQIKSVDSTKSNKLNDYMLFEYYIYCSSFKHAFTDCCVGLVFNQP